MTNFLLLHIFFIFYFTFFIINHTKQTVFLHHYEHSPSAFIILQFFFTMCSSLGEMWTKYGRVGSLSSLVDHV